MNEWGVFSVARDIWDHPVLNSKEPFTKREAWMWLCSAAAWKPYKHADLGRIVALERGEFCHSIRFLERKWSWKSGRVERFLNVLEKHDMIRDTSRDGSKVYLISNYNEYQLGAVQNRDSERDTNRDSSATVARQHRDKEETFKHSTSKTPSLRSGDKSPKRKTQIPDDFPSQAQFEAAVEHWTERGRTDLCATVADEGAAFRDKAISDGWTALDWSAKWRTWYRNTMKFNKLQRVNGHGRESPHEQTERIARELARESQSRDQSADFGADRRARIALPRLLAHDG